MTNKSKCSLEDRSNAKQGEICISKVFTPVKGTPRTVNGWKEIANDPKKLDDLGITKNVYNSLKEKYSGKKLVKRLRAEVSSKQAEKEGYKPTMVRKGNKRNKFMKIVNGKGHIKAHKYRKAKSNDSTNLVGKKVSPFELNRNVMQKTTADMYDGNELKSEFKGSDGNKKKKNMYGKNLKRSSAIKKKIEDKYGSIYKKGKGKGDLPTIRKTSTIDKTSPIEHYCDELKSEGLIDENLSCNPNKFLK